MTPLLSSITVDELKDPLYVHPDFLGMSRKDYKFFHSLNQPVWKRIKSNKTYATGYIMATLGATSCCGAAYVILTQGDHKLWDGISRDKMGRMVFQENPMGQYATATFLRAWKEVGFKGVILVTHNMSDAPVSDLKGFISRVTNAIEPWFRKVSFTPVDDRNLVFTSEPKDGFGSIEQAKGLFK